VILHPALDWDALCLCKKSDPRSSRSCQNYVHFG
jgi:hypothetical protein